MYNRFDVINTRRNLKLTQEVLAASIGISRQYLSKVENGLKPLNNNILAWLEQRNIRKTNGLPRTPKNELKKGAKKLLKINKLEITERPDIVQFSKVADFSNSEQFSDNKSWEKWWWNHYHALCLKCRNECKQSSQARIIECPQYNES